MLGAMSSDETSGSQRAIKRPRVPPGPLADLKELLYQLYLEAGTPRLKQIAGWAALAGQAGMPGPDTVARIIGSATMPPSQADLVTVVTVLARAARWDPDDAAQRARDLWVEAKIESARTPVGGVRVSEADPRRLGVHAAISMPGVSDEVMPEYVLRDADGDESGVRAKVAAAAERGGFVLLVGGSSVGKTRSAFEAVTALLPDWWLVHPADPPEVAALAAAPTPQTVVWLDELQRYLDGRHGLTGAVVRALLNAVPPAVIIGTLWPDRYTAYTTLPVSGADPHGREREVLDLAEVVRIAPELSVAERDRAHASATRDQRLRVALEAPGYGLTQTLAAAPQLVARWQDAKTTDPYAWAVLTAALDVARLGASSPLSASFLRAAAPGYCTSQQQAEAPKDWFEQAVTYATGKLHGAAAALSAAGAGMGQVSGYTVADYLLQHASRERHYERVPASTWDAILDYIHDPADNARLGESAINRLLYRYTIPMYRHAADAGYGGAARQLTELLVTRGDLDGAAQILRAWSGKGAGAGDEAEQLTELLIRRGDLDRLQAWADAGDTYAAGRLADLLAERGDLDGLRARTDAGDEIAAGRLADLLAERGDLDEAAQILRPLADATGGYAAGRLADLLVERGDLDGLRVRTDAGDKPAARALARLLAKRGDLDEAAQILGPLADGGDWDALYQLANLLAECGDLDGLRARVDAGDRPATFRLADLLAERGDLGEAAQVLRPLAAAGDQTAAKRQADLLAKRGDLDEAAQILRPLAAAGDGVAARTLAGLLVERGDLDGLRAQADAGNEVAAWRLSALLKERGDLDGRAQILRALADAGNTIAAMQLAEPLTERGDLDGLQAWADAGNTFAAWWLAELLAERGDLDGLRARTDVGDEDAAKRLAGLLEKRGDFDEAARILRPLADAGDLNAELQLAWLLARRGDFDQLRARTDAGDGTAAAQLVGVLSRQGRGEEAERLRRFGLNPDGSIASA